MTHPPGRVLLSPQESRAWFQNRAMLRAAADNNCCKCGEKNTVRAVKRGDLLKRVETYCKHRMWFNFWKHDPPKIVLEF